MRSNLYASGCTLWISLFYKRVIDVLASCDILNMYAPCELLEFWGCFTKWKFMLHCSLVWEPLYPNWLVDTNAVEWENVGRRIVKMY